MKNTNKKTGFLIFLFLISLSAKSQTIISGNKNVFTKVTGVISSDKLSVESVANFNINDTVLIIQMKGANLDSLSNLRFNNTGRYEFLIIQSINSGLQQIKFQHYFINKYDPAQSVQLVRVPSYQDAIVSQELTCQPWDGKTGGIVAIIVNDTLALKADISADASGFKGGDTTIYDVPCSNIPEPEPLNFQPNERIYAGLKGEGIIWNNFATTRGRGAIANGGGGGNNKHSGGGGGAGIGDGGLGGLASGSCGFSPSVTTEGEGASMPKIYFGNKGVKELNDTIFKDRIFFGGGGGASNGLTPLSTIKGGNGGGIVFIITRFLKTNGFSISANGESMKTPAKSDGGAGGGGGGGSIMIAFDSLTGPLNLNATGGNGGNTQGYNTGQGGGGGGGFIWLSPEVYSITQVKIDGGEPGVNILDNKSSAYPGQIGDTAVKLNPVLNGFLFNIIGSPQTICYLNTPDQLVGSKPRGGDGNYTYVWQKKSKKTSWQTIAGATDKNYQPDPLTDSSFYRRIVTVKRFKGAANDDIVADTSKFIEVCVIPEIKQNTIQPDTAICFGLSPVLIKGLKPSGGDGTPISVKWEISSDGENWQTPSSGNTFLNYALTSNTTTMYYRRIAMSDICSLPSNIVKILVYPSINHNSALIGSSQTICLDTKPSNFSGINTTPTGGSGTYNYRWEKSTPDSTNWVNTGITSGLYVTGNHSQNTYYRRVITSGLNNTCKDTSNIIKITVVPRINNNSLTSANQTICQNTIPARITGSFPSGGDGKYRYQWNLLKNNAASWDSLSTGVDFQNFIPEKITIEGIAKYQRIVRSGLNDCCRDTSAQFIAVNIQPAIKNNDVGYDTTICYGQTPVKMLPTAGMVTGGDGSEYTFFWFKHPENSPWITPSELNTDQTFESSALHNTTFFARVVKSGTCTDTSNIISIKVLPEITGNILLSSFNKVCQDSVPKTLYCAALSGGNAQYRYIWMSRSGKHDEAVVQDAHEAQFTFSKTLKDTTVFRRIVISGLHDCCIDTSAPYPVFLINRPALPENEITIDTTFTFAFDLHALPFQPKDSGGLWTAVQDPNIIFTPQDNPTTHIDKLKFGKNTVTWTLFTSKACPPSVTTILINVSDIVRYTGFSPNGDQLNQYFVIDGLDPNDAIESKELIVLNRWGNEVYSNKQYDNSWDGNNQKGIPLPDDTYYYVLKVKLRNNDQHLYKGFVVIKH